MKIINLIEDSEGEQGLLFEHGLCFYVETEKHRLLVDTGASDAFIKNAAIHGVDLASVDTLIISHGHYDHAGGVLAFAALNPAAKIYINKNATGAFYNLKNGTEKYIGMDARIAALPQVVFINGNFSLDEEISVFTGVRGKKLTPRGNSVLKKKQGDAFVQDDFDHEQYVLVSAENKRILISGCAHKGILNILDTYAEIFGTAPTHVISGFHTVKNEYTREDDAIIEGTARLLNETPTVYYSGHCTGDYALCKMKAIMGEKLVLIHSGDKILDTKKEG